MEKDKNRLEHSWSVMAWALSLQPDTQACCMEQLSTDNGDLRKMVDKVVSWLHYPPCPNKNVVNECHNDQLLTNTSMAIGYSTKIMLLIALTLFSLIKLWNHKQLPNYLTTNRVISFLHISCPYLEKLFKIDRTVFVTLTMYTVHNIFISYIYMYTSVSIYKTAQNI